MNAVPMLIMIAAAVVLMTFMSRKQKRNMQAQQALQNDLAFGDRVMTTSGMYGTVVGTDDESTIDIEIAPGMTTTWLRAAVREKVQPDLDDVPEVEQIDDEPAAVDAEPVDSIEAAHSDSDVDDDREPAEHGKKSSGKDW